VYTSQSLGGFRGTAPPARGRVLSADDAAWLHFSRPGARAAVLASRSLWYTVACPAGDLETSSAGHNPRASERDQMPMRPVWLSNPVPEDKKFVYLLVVIALYPITAVLLDKQPIIAIAVDVVFLTVAMLIVLKATQNRYFRIAIPVLTVVVLLQNALTAESGLLMVSTTLEVARTTSIFVFLMTGIVVVLSRVLDRGLITIDKVCGAISVYLLMGFAWGMLYMLLNILQPASFHLPELNTAGVLDPSLRRYDISLADFIYLSFVTLSTLGYGDITPTTIPGQTVVWMEAILGQIYLAVLIARLVSLQIMHSSPRPARRRVLRSTERAASKRPARVHTRGRAPRRQGAGAPERVT
jgi:hypothetical protein